jgi:hypothetical protein
MLTIHIPEDLERELSSVTKEKYTFIIDAIREKISSLKNTATSPGTGKVYEHFYEEKRISIEEFKNTDIENWGDY